MPPTSSPRDRLAPGSRWVCTNRRHHGLVVEVVRLGRRSVHVRTTGPGWSRAHRHAGWTVPIEIFLSTTCPARA